MDFSEEDELLSLDSDSNDVTYAHTSVKKKKTTSLKKGCKKKSRLEPNEANQTSSFGIRFENGSSSGQHLENASEVYSDFSDGTRTHITSENTSRALPEETEITLSDDEDEDNTTITDNTRLGSHSRDNPQNLDSQVIEPSNTTTSRYELRRKRTINYTEIDSALDTMVADSTSFKNKSQMKKEVLDIFSLSTSRISKLIEVPDLIDNYTKCKITFMDGTDSTRLHLVTRFFEKCGSQFETIYVRIRYDEENYMFLQSVLRASTVLTRLDYRYLNCEDALEFLKLLQALRENNGLSTLKSLKLVSVSGTNSLKERHIKLLSDLNVSFQSLELGDSLWDDVTSSSLNKILENHKSSLERFVLHGGFRGDADKDKILITFPKMESLSTLQICPIYTFLSEIKNPHSKKARMITIGMNEKEDPLKVSIKFVHDPPNLKRLVLGNLIEVEDLHFSTIRRLTEFRCGSYWNLSIRFPSDGSRKSLMESTITELQFPDALKDPSFPVKVVKHFPNLKKVWMYLPSVPVLRAFFKAFGKSQLEELYLKTQFDFESTMESCLLPNMSDVLRKSKSTETILQTLKEYKHFDEYIRYHNVELPVEAEDLMEGQSAGIRALKSLKVLHLEHIPRILLIPVPDDERKWYDHHCKFMNTTFGYERYPLNFPCHREILGLDLSEYIWKNIQINSEFTEDFYEAGFVDIPDVQVISESRNFHRADEEEDLFIPIRSGRDTAGAQIKIMPSMLLPEVKAKAERM